MHDHADAATAVNVNEEPGVYEDDAGDEDDVVGGDAEDADEDAEMLHEDHCHHQDDQ